MAILLLLALFLAWPTAGLSIVIFVALYIGRGILRKKARMHEVDKLRAHKALAKGESNPPSWLQNEEKCEAFIHGIQNLPIGNINTFKVLYGKFT